MSKITLNGFIIVPESELRSVLAELSNHIELTRHEPGCVSFEVSQDADIKNRFNVKEEFDSRASFQEHQKRVQSSEWGKISQNVERHYKIKAG